MNKHSCLKSLPMALTVVGMTLGHLPAQTTIFTEDFAGDVATDLSGATPNTTTDDATWVASSNFKADGTFAGTAGSATLAFLPVDGAIYSLDATVTVIGASSNWLAVGFVSGQSTDSGITNRFVNGNSTLGRAWMLARGDNSQFPNVAHTQTTGDPVPWSGAIANANGGDLDFRIILNTNGGAGAWTATWFAKRPADASYTEVRSETILPNEEINAVGIAIGNSDISGTIKSFSLTSDAQPANDPPTIIAMSRTSEGDIVLTLNRPAEGLEVQRSDKLETFADIASTSDGNTLTIAAINVDPNEDGSDFYRVRE